MTLPCPWDTMAGSFSMSEPGVTSTTCGVGPEQTESRVTSMAELRLRAEREVEMYLVSPLLGCR